ncbi:MAG: O-antigen ligase family protein [Pirellulaceae bacterium]|nr:O-antigen ligase family protein [Pirellulaceae bacterium]
MNTVRTRVLASVSQWRLRRRLPAKSRSTRLAPQRHLHQLFQAAFLRLNDAGLLAALFIAPLFMGGRHPLGKLVLTTIVWITAVSWFAAKSFDKTAKWSWSGAELIFLLAIVLIVLQLFPLPPNALQVMSPTQTELLPMWNASAASLGTWQTVSLSPERTRRGLCLLVAYSVLFMVTYQRLRSLTDIERLLKWIALAAISMAVLGLLQYLLGNGKFLWIYEHPSRNTLHTVKGPFANQNHYAHFLAIGMAPLIGWLTAAAQREKSQKFHFQTAVEQKRFSPHTPMFLSLGLVTVAFAGLQCFSRGGILIILLVACTCLVMLTTTRQINRKTLFYGIGLLSTISVAILIHGRQRLLARLGTITAGSLDQIDPSGARRRIWTAVADAVPDFAWWGSGVGSHQNIYPVYMTEWTEFGYTHAENGYLQVLLEAGIPGFLLVAALILLTGYWLVSSLRRSTSQQITTLSGVLLAIWIASIVHSFVDFVWYIPACMSCTVLCMAAAGRLFQLSQPAANDTSDISLCRFHSFACVIAIVFVACLSLPTLQRPAFAATAWESYLKISLTTDRDVETQAQINRREMDSFGHHDQESLTRMERYLIATLRHDPNDARAHLRLSTNYLRRFDRCQRLSENPMSLWSIREAAINSNFPSLAAQHEWLTVATGKHLTYLSLARNHALQAIRLSPLQGKAYLHLCDLAFLSGHNPMRNALISQALAVRPHDGDVLYMAGYDAIQAGDMQGGAKFLQQAFCRGPAIQAVIIESLALQVHPEAFITVFQPDHDGLERLFNYYRFADLLDEARIAGKHYSEQLGMLAGQYSGPEAARLWYRCQEVHSYLQQIPQAIDATRKALEADPGDYQLNFLLGSRLQQAGDYQQARQQFRWCARRKPNDPTVKIRLAQIDNQMR